MRMLPIVVTGLVLMGCSVKPAPLGPQPLDVKLGPTLDSAQIRSEMVGNTGSGTRTGTTSVWNVFVSPDGTIVGKSTVLADTGMWRISDDGKFCMTWKSDWHGQEICQSVHKAGAGIQLASPDSVEELIFTPGNKL
jgi:hypothetical protein